VRLSAHPLVCREAVELMSDYIEGSLSRRNRKRLEKHLADCPHCTMYLDQMRATIAASGAVHPDDLDPEALDDLTELFRQYRGDADQG
jgi:anti-sigma factor RsiW